MASLSSRAAGPPQVEDPGVLSRWASAATGIYSGGKLAAGAEGGTRRAEPQKKVEARLASHSLGRSVFAPRFLSFCSPTSKVARIGEEER